MPTTLARQCAPYHGRALYHGFNDLRPILLHPTCFRKQSFHAPGFRRHPDARWVLQQARNFILLTDQEATAPTHLIRDFDTKFTQAFDSLLEADGIEAVKVGPAAPNLNAYAERFVLWIKSECL